MKTLEQYTEIINEYISDIKYPNSPINLYEPIQYSMDNAGKRLRPALTLIFCEAAGGNYKQALSQACGIEMFHNFTLLHDDVMDRADLRRGKPTVHVKWDTNTAILSGDAMLTLATRLVADSNSIHAAEMMKLFIDTSMGVYEGQQLDMDYETTTDVTVEQYIDMIRLKTSVLLGCACRMGGLCGDSTESDAKYMYNFGVNLGVAFQLQDDLLDVYGDRAIFGKKIGGDILNNKKTFLLIETLKRATGEDERELHGWLSTIEKTRAKIDAVTELYNRLGVRTACEYKIKEYSILANKAIDNMSFAPAIKDYLRNIVNIIMHRNH